MMITVVYHLVGGKTVTTVANEDEFDMDRQTEELVDPRGMIIAQLAQPGSGEVALAQIPTRSILYAELISDSA